MGKVVIFTLKEGNWRVFLSLNRGQKESQVPIGHLPDLTTTIFQLFNFGTNPALRILS